MNQIDLAGRRAIITGGAQGIGLATAERFIASGAEVVLWDINAANLDRATDALGGSASGRVVELTDESAVNDAAREAGAIDILVNNAGITRDAPFHKMTREQWSDVIDTNLSGVFNMTHPIWPGMRERKFGRVITISSINGQKGQFAQVNYSASKAGDLGITKALAQEGARFGITANAICPGYIATDMVMAVPEKVRESIIAQIPAGRLGEPEEIARCVVFLASDAAEFVNGSTITVNGGQHFV